MNARKVLENAALGLDQLGVLFEAFDGAWEVLKPEYEESPSE